MSHSREFEHDPYQRGGSSKEGFERVANRFMDFVRSRTADHWLMFLAGVVIGVIIG